MPSEKEIEDEIPAYQGIDIVLGLNNNPIKPVKGFYVSCADDCGRKALPYPFALTPKEAESLYKTAEQASKHKPTIHKAWIHDCEGRTHWTPR